MIKLTWQDIDEIVDKKVKDYMKVFHKHKYVYGVPTGGIPVAILFAKGTGLELIETLDNYIPDEVLIVDDIIDSGKTRAYYLEYCFISLWNKEKDGGEWIEFPWERMKNQSPAEDSVVRMLEYIGENPKRNGLLETPKRVVRAWDYIFSGYKTDVASLMKTFEDADYDYNQIVLLKDIEIFSMCEHHALPFSGRASVAYIPNKKVIGVSKLARIVDAYSKRLQIQERLGEQVTGALMEYLQPQGAACIIEAKHLCMQMRGVEKQHSTMVTSSLKGVFLDDSKAREELMQLIKN